MIGKCVLYVSGIVNKQMVFIEEYKGHNIYYRKDEPEGMKFVSHNDCMFPLAWDVEKIKLYIDTNPNIENDIVSTFERSLIDCERVSLGYAQYLNRIEEYNKAIETKQERKLQEQREREEKQRQREEQERLQLEKEMNETEEIFKTGKRIDADIFLKLCDKYKIKTAIKTRGWIINSLSDICINEDNSCSYSYSGNKSTKIGDIARELMKILKLGTNEPEEATQEQMNHLFGIEGYKAV